MYTINSENLHSDIDSWTQIDRITIITEDCQIDRYLTTLCHSIKDNIERRSVCLKLLPSLCFIT